ncbi:MAG: type II secretion system protein [bacterium]
MKKKRFYNKNKKQGFTLLELMIVIAIISILVVVMIPNFVNARNATKLTSCSSILKNIASVVEIYSNDYEGKYPASDFTITLSGNPLASYIDKDYKCPVNKSYYEYKVNMGGNSYFIYCPIYFYVIL